MSMRIFAKSVVLVLMLIVLIVSSTSSATALAYQFGNSTTGSITGPLGTPVSQGFDGMGQVATRQPSADTDTMTWDEM